MKRCLLIKIKKLVLGVFILLTGTRIQVEQLLSSFLVNSNITRVPKGSQMHYWWPLSNILKILLKISTQIIRLRFLRTHGVRRTLWNAIGSSFGRESAPNLSGKTGHNVGSKFRSELATIFYKGRSIRHAWMFIIILPLPVYCRYFSELSGWQAANRW